MSGAFENEAARTSKFRDLFYEFSGISLEGVNIDGAMTDGSLRLPSGQMLCNMEVKVDKGEGGDPYMQNVAYYCKSLNANVQCPCFALELCGPQFSVSGFINTDDHVICEPLTRTYNLFALEHSHFTYELAQLFESLLFGLNALQEYCMDRHPPTSFPFVKSSIDLGGEELDFKIKEHITGLVFKADMEGNTIVVKFCKRYGLDVHKHLSGTFAPKLLAYQELGSFKVVVMEHLELRSLEEKDRD